MKYIDTHAHLNLSAFNEDVEAVAADCALRGVTVINVGTKESTSVRAVELASQYEHMYAIIGLHPIQTVPGRHDEDETGEGAKPFTSKGESFNKAFYDELAKHPKVVKHAIEAMKRAGFENPIRRSIRGGTDGSRLSFMGLPCPNIFAGEHAFHSKYEWVSVQDMNKAAETMVHLAQIWEEKG